MGMQASQEGAGRVVDEVHGSSGAWPAILGVVASRGWRGAWRAREGARASGFELNQGRESGFGQGRDAWAAGGSTGVMTAATAMNGVSREGRWSEGSFVNKAKFKTPVCKLHFYPYSKGQMKIF